MESQTYTLTPSDNKYSPLVIKHDTDDAQSSVSCSTPTLYNEE